MMIPPAFMKKSHKKLSTQTDGDKSNQMETVVIRFGTFENMDTAVPHLSPGM